MMRWSFLICRMPRQQILRKLRYGDHPCDRSIHLAHSNLFRGEKMRVAMKKTSQCIHFHFPERKWSLRNCLMGCALIRINSLSRFALVSVLREAGKLMYAQGYWMRRRLRIHVFRSSSDSRTHSARLGGQLLCECMIVDVLAIRCWYSCCFSCLVRLLSLAYWENRTWLARSLGCWIGWNSSFGHLLGLIIFFMGFGAVM